MRGVSRRALCEGATEPGFDVFGGQGLMYFVGGLSPLFSKNTKIRFASWKIKRLFRKKPPKHKPKLLVFTKLLNPSPISSLLYPVRPFYSYFEEFLYEMIVILELWILKLACRCC